MNKAFLMFLIFATTVGSARTQQPAPQTQVSVTVNNQTDSALATKQAIVAENGQQIGQAMGKALAAAIQAAMLKHNLKKALEKGAAWCAAHPGAEHGFKMSDSLSGILGVSAYSSCDDGKQTFHEQGWKPDLSGKTLTPIK
jgi:hypothetical protein